MSANDPEIRAPIAQAATPGRTRLITSPTDLQVYTFDREADTRSALARGLQEYLETASIDWFDGNRFEFREVHRTWAAPEDPALFPAASVVAAVPAEYEDDRLGSPQLITLEDGTGRRIKIVAEMMQQFDLWIWGSTDNERAAMTAVVEDMLEPNDWMTGLRLELPFYFNSRATYEKVDIVYDDGEGGTQRRWRKSIMSITGNLSQIVPISPIPDMNPRLVVEVTVGSGC